MNNLIGRYIGIVRDICLYRITLSETSEAYSEIFFRSDNQIVYINTVKFAIPYDVISTRETKNYYLYDYYSSSICIVYYHGNLNDKYYVQHLSFFTIIDKGFNERIMELVDRERIGGAL